MMKKNISVIILAALCVLTAHAQNNIDSKVEVKREYQGSVLQTSKSQLDTRISDTLRNFNLNFDYPTFYRPYKDLYEFSPYGVLDLSAPGKIRYPWMVVKLGVAYPWTPDADLYLTPLKNERFSLMLHYNHDSFWGKLPEIRMDGGMSVRSDQKSYGDHMVNRAGGMFDFRWKSGELRLMLDYSNNFYAYNGMDADHEDMNSGTSGLSHKGVRTLASHTFNLLQTGLSVRSTDVAASSFFYDVNLRYRYLDEFKNQMLPPESGEVEYAENIPAENGLDVEVSLGAKIRSEHKLYLKVSNTADFYRQDGIGTAISGIWKVEPVYSWERDRWRIQAGLAFSSTYSADDAYLRGMIYPDVYASFEAVRNNLWIYLKAYGEDRYFSQYDITSLNPWFGTAAVQSTQRKPVAALLGLKGTVLGRFSYDLYGGYEIVRGMLSFMADRMYQQPYTGDTQAAVAGASLHWMSRSVTADVDLLYHYFSEPEKALMRPSFSLDASVEYNYRKRLYVTATCGFRTQVRGGVLHTGQEIPSVYEIPSFVDLGIRVLYNINTRVGVYAEGKNVLNSHIQYFSNYLEPGATVGIGMYLKL